MSNILKGAGTGATMGSALGPWGSLAGGLIGGAASGFLSSQPKETPIQSQQRELVDQLLQSVRGQGPYSNLFNVDEQAFQKSFVDPMKQQFSSQIAPQIQQSFIASGQQRGTGLEDQLTRAGVDMDQLLNQQYFQAQQAAQNRGFNALQNVLGAGPGVLEPLGKGQAALQGIGGYLSSDKFGGTIQNILNSFANDKDQRQGFVPEKNDLQDTYYELGKQNQVYNPYTGEMR